MLHPATDCSPAHLASSHPSAVAAQHSRQLHVAMASGTPAAAASLLLSGSSACGTLLSVLYSHHGQSPSSRLTGTSAAGSTADGTLRYRAYASRAAQALTKGHAAGPGTQQQVSMRISVASPNQIAEPYT